MGQELQKPTEPKRYVAYYRVSKKGGTGLGIEAQRESVARFTGSNKPIEEFTEEESGDHDSRPQLSAALAKAKASHAILLIATIDRLARNVHFISGLMESSVDFVVADMPDANRVTLHILAAIAEHEREMISRRTKAALAEAKRRGTKLGNPRWQPALVKAREAKRQLNDPATPLERMRLYRSEGMSLRDIAGKLNAAGIKTRSGHIWYASTVRQVLKAA